MVIKLDEPEGATPIDDISGLKIRGITTREQLNQAEFENITKAMVKYLSSNPSKRTAPFTLNWCKKLHKEMLCDVWGWAGEFRHDKLIIGIDAYRIQTELQQTLDDLLFWQKNKTYTITEQAAILHHKCVYIHPFKNGNGRWARLMADIWLMQNSLPSAKWPEDVNKKSPFRAKYIKALKDADNHDNRAIINLYKELTNS